MNAFCQKPPKTQKLNIPNRSKNIFKRKLDPFSSENAGTLFIHEWHFHLVEAPGSLQKPI